MIELLITEIQDVRVRENFRRIRAALKDIYDQVDSSGSSSNIIDITTSISIWSKINSTVSSSSSNNIDVVSLSNFKTAKYIVTVYNEVEGVNRSFEVLIINEGGALSDQLYTRIGSLIDIEINVNLSAGNMELEIVNNEAYGLNITAAKLLL